jgi:hypothetical protein
MFEKEILDLFKVMVVPTSFGGEPNLSNVDRGYITDFEPTPSQLKVLNAAFKPLDIITLFTVEERKKCEPCELIAKQILHYVEVYGLGAPGAFNLEQENGKIVTLTKVRGVVVEELSEIIAELLYTNAPVKDAPTLMNIIKAYNIDFDINKVANNELRVLLFDDSKTFTSGDDVVRYMCYVSTKSSMLIKSKQVIEAIKLNAHLFNKGFLTRHEVPLAKVFHRHKNLILAAKTNQNSSAINRISRLAKNLHVPIIEGLNKKFVAEALAGRIKDYSILDKISIRDKFKFLNFIEYKMLGYSLDAFIIRNGKVHLEDGRAVQNKDKLIVISGHIIESLEKDLHHLKGKNILLDPYVDYGLPISRKQTFGQLPFGTSVISGGNKICTGIYWENSWGANDLDLSAVDMSGSRTGWGRSSGYESKQDVVFSGDLTDARNGAMEFMTSKVSYTQTYALFNNIFSGEIEAEFELVVGDKSKENWIKSPVLRERGTLDSRGTILGFVKGPEFVVYNCRLNNSSWSEGSKEQAIVRRGMTDFWTIRRLFDVLGVNYSVDFNEEVEYDYNLTYSSFSLDKLENMIFVA